MSISFIIASVIWVITIAATMVVFAYAVSGNPADNEDLKFASIGVFTVGSAIAGLIAISHHTLG